jgi:aminopeptidase N
MGYFHIWREGGDKPLAQLENDRWDHNLSDSKGMWLYHMVRQRMGDAAFFGALRQLLVRFQTRPMTVADIRSQLVSAAPADTGLRSFLSQWLDRKGAPVLDVDWWSEWRPPAAGADPEFGATVRVRQRQQGEPFALDLEVALTLQDSTTVLDTLHISGRDHTFELDLPSRPLELRVDPFHRVLMWRPEYGPRPPGAD